MSQKSINSNESLDFLTLEEAARFIRRPVQHLRAKVANKRIPYIPPAEEPIFYKPHLIEYMLSIEIQPDQHATATKISNNRTDELLRLIIELSAFNPEYLRHRVNLRLRKAGKVLAQLYPDSDSRGLYLAIPESEGDKALPQAKSLDKLPAIEDLARGKGPAGSWLRGDGKRFTHSPAVAFHISNDIADDPDHAAWSDIRELLEYAKKRGQ